MPRGEDGEPLDLVYAPGLVIVGLVSYRGAGLVWSYRVERNGRIVDRLWMPLPSVWYIKRLWRLERQLRRHSVYAKHYLCLGQPATRDD